MSKPVLIYYDVLQYQPENLQRLHDNFDVISLPTPADDTDEALTVADVSLCPLGYYCGPEKMDRMPKLKVLGSNTTGHPHIDVGYAAHRGIKVVTLKPEKAFLDTITPTSEHTFGLILALTRNLIPAHRAVLEGHWNRRPFGAPAMLSSLSLGIVGLGRLGRKVARYAHAFGMAVTYYDPYVEQGPETPQRCADLKSLVACSDIVTLHVPHEPETENLIDAELLAAFKPGSYLINTARGELLDFTALLAQLESGHLGGAALDVFEGEFAPDFAARLPHHALWRYAQTHPNLILTPHIGGSTVDAWRLTEGHTITRILEALREQ